MITKDVLSHNTNNCVEGIIFREEQLYKLKCDEIMRKNEVQIKKLFEMNLGNMQKYLHLNDVTRILKKANLNISDAKINSCFIECLMSKIDCIRD